MKDNSIVNTLGYLKANKLIKLFHMNEHILKLFINSLILKFKNITFKKKCKGISITNY